MKKVISIIAIVGVLAGFNIASAAVLQNGAYQSGTFDLRVLDNAAVGLYKGDVAQTDIFGFLGGLIKAGLGILTTIFIVLIFYAGYLYFTAGGEKAQTIKAKEWMTNAVIGLILAFLSYTLASFLFDVATSRNASDIGPLFKPITNELNQP